MNIIGILLLIVYLIGVLIFPYPIFRGLLNGYTRGSYNYGEPDNAQVTGYFLCSLALALAWPVLAPFAVSYFTFTRSTRFNLKNEIEKLKEQAAAAEKLTALKEKQRKLQDKQEAEAERLANEIMAELDELTGTHEYTDWRDITRQGEGNRRYPYKASS